MTQSMVAARPATLALVLLVALVPAARADAPDADALIAEVRRATVRYLDVVRAREDGFVQMSGMEPRHGYHFMKRDLRVLSATLDLANPPVLLYVERAGAWQLVGVEYVLPQRPSSSALPGSAWDQHAASCHYRDWRELPRARARDCPARHPESGASLVHWHPTFAVAHVWAWYPNPDGVFARENRYLASWESTTAATAGGHQHGRNAAEIAYSEMNHRVAGAFLVVLAALAVVATTSARAGLARSLAAVVWIGFGAYLFVSADPEAWPLGGGRIAGVFTDGLVLQHKLLSLIPMTLGCVEAVRAIGRGAAVAWLAPALAIVGGFGLFFHAHEGGEHFDRTFVQHLAMGAAAVVAGGALLVVGRFERCAARLRWAWPAVLAVTAGVLLFYAE